MVNSVETLPTRPVLTFPDEVATWVRQHYAESETILEYGTGGSTVMASEMPGKSIFAVESDKDWAANLESYISTSDQTRSPVQMHWVDVGPTKRWGIPQTTRFWKNYWHYPISVWSREDFVQPDVILADGIFRSACVLTAMMMTQKPVTLLFDDYMNPRQNHETVRPRHAGIEKLIQPVEIKQRMAKFVITPGQYERPMFPDIVSCFFRHY